MNWPAPNGANAWIICRIWRHRFALYVRPRNYIELRCLRCGARAE